MIQLSFLDRPTSIATGERLRDEGIKQAADHAGPDWQSEAFALLREYPGDEFQTEQIREFAYARGLAAPPDDRAWGAVIRAAQSAGMIEAARYELVKNARAHRRPATVWRRVV